MSQAMRGDREVRAAPAMPAPRRRVAPARHPRGSYARTRPAPRVMRGLAIGLGIALAGWLAIAMLVLALV